MPAAALAYMASASAFSNAARLMPALLCAVASSLASSCSSSCTSPWAASVWAVCLIRSAVLVNLGRDCTALAALAALAATDCATEESILVVSAAAGSATLWATMAAASTDAPKR